MRLRRVLCAAGVSATVAGAVLIGGMPGAGASQPGPWQPFRSTPTSFAAGVVCPFAETGVPVADEERFRNLATYPDGTPQEQQFTGLLKFKYSNPPSTPSGEWVLTGTFDAVLHPDGTKDFTLEHGTAENLCDTLA